MTLPDFSYKSDFISIAIANAIFATLKSNIEWKQEKIRIFGKEVLEPRLVAWYGDKPYKYTGKLMLPLAWTALLLDLKNTIEQSSGHIFNTVLLNYYRNGQDSMGWHSDDEPELGRNPVVASLNFGEARKFQFRLKSDKNTKHEIWLENGSLLIMKGDTQHLWQHSLPKSSKAIGERINMTFRYIL